MHKHIEPDDIRSLAPATWDRHFAINLRAPVFLAHHISAALPSNADAAIVNIDKAPKTESDRACPHGVQFYDVVIDGHRHERAAWSYEAPQPQMKRVSGRFGFWEDVKVA